jgi:hypothetical protein
MALDDIHGVTAIDMMEIGLNVSNMAKDKIYSLMVTYTQANTGTVSLGVSEYINGGMAVFTKVNLKMALNMAKVNGQRDKVTINARLKVTTLMERRKATVNLNGQVETSIEVNIKMTKDTDMVKCTGMIKVDIREVGSMASSTERVS